MMLGGPAVIADLGIWLQVNNQRVSCSVKQFIIMSDMRWRRRGKWAGAHPSLLGEEEESALLGGGRAVSPAAQRPPFVVFFSIVGAQTRTTTNSHHMRVQTVLGPLITHLAARLSVSPHPPQEARSCNIGRSCVIGLLVVFYHHPKRRAPGGPSTFLFLSRVLAEDTNADKTNKQTAAGAKLFAG